MKRGIYCLEGYWGYATCTEGILRALRCQFDVQYAHLGPVTLSQFWEGIDFWTSDMGRKVPVLYLVFHGGPGHVLVGDETVTLKEISERISDAGNKRTIHFGACSTLNLPPDEIQKFLCSTNLKLITGYVSDVSVGAACLEDFRVLSGFFSRHGN